MMFSPATPELEQLDRWSQGKPVGCWWILTHRSFSLWKVTASAGEVRVNIRRRRGETLQGMLLRGVGEALRLEGLPPLELRRLNADRARKAERGRDRRAAAKAGKRHAARAVRAARGLGTDGAS